jgi:hypothetical protein
MRDMLPPLFQIGTGLSFALLLVIGLLARKAIGDLAGRLTAFGVLAVALGFFLLSEATDSTSLGAGADMFIAAGAAFFLAAVLVTAGLFIRARSAD